MTTDRLTLVLNPDQIPHWRSAEPARGYEVLLTWRLDTRMALAELGCDCLQAWSFLEAADLDDALDRCLAVRDSWWQPDLEGLVHHGVDLALCMGRDMHYCFLESMAVRAIMGRVLDELRPVRLAVVQGPRRPVFWDPPGSPFPDVFNAVALWTAHERGIPTEVLPGAEPWLPPFHGVQRRFPGPPPASPFPAPVPGRPEVLFFLSNTDHHKQRPLIREVFECGRYSPSYLASGEFKAPEAGGRLVEWTSFLARFGPDPALQRAVEHRRGRLPDDLGPLAGELSCVFANPGLSHQWEDFWERLVLAGRIVDATRWLLETARPKAVIMGAVANGPWRCFARTARTLGVPTLAVSHTPALPYGHLFDLWPQDFDLLCVEGEAIRRGFVRRGRAPESVAATGSLYSPVPPLEQRGGDTVLMLTTRAGCGLAAPLAGHDGIERDWRSLAGLMARMPGVRFEIKPHPRGDYGPIYRDLTAGLDNVRVLDPTEPLEQGLARASAVVAVDVCSTASLEAALAGLPSLVYTGAIFKARGLRSMLDDCLPSADTAEALAAWLDTALHDDTGRARITAEADAALADFASTRDPAQTVANILERLDRLVESQS